MNPDKIRSSIVAEINGEIFTIDFASKFKDAYANNDKLEYLGRGVQYSIDGIRDNSGEYHFWRYKKEVKQPELLIDNRIAELIDSLNALQARTIGLFRNNHIAADKKFELVLSDHIGLLHTVTIGELGGLCDSHIPQEKGTYKRFPENKSLLEMKSNPFALDEFIKSFDKK